MGNCANSTSSPPSQKHSLDPHDLIEWYILIHFTADFWSVSVWPWLQMECGEQVRWCFLRQRDNRLSKAEKQTSKLLKSVSWKLNDPVGAGCLVLPYEWQLIGRCLVRCVMAEWCQVKIGGKVRRAIGNAHNSSKRWEREEERNRQNAPIAMHSFKRQKLN